MKNKLFILLFAISGTAFLASCGSGQHEEAGEGTDSTAASQQTTKKQNVFYAMPSPIQVGKMIKKAGAKYDKALLSNPENASKYASNLQKAMNLGVYGADLSYSAIFDQSQEVILYFNTAKKLADDLGISGAFTSETIKRMQSNSSNHDSLLTIISETFLSSNEFLKENERNNTAMLTITGGFIEGLYVATQMAKATGYNPEIVKRIAELRGPINNLSKMIEETSGAENEGIELMEMNVLSPIREIKAVYDEMKVENGQMSVTAVDTTKKSATIGGGAKYEFTTDQIQRLTDVVASLRAEIVKF